MAKTNDSKSEPAEVAAPAPTADTGATKLTLDRAYIHQGRTFGPGEVDVPADALNDLKGAIERAKKADQEQEMLRRGIDAREDARRDEIARAAGETPKSESAK